MGKLFGKVDKAQSGADEKDKGGVVHKVIVAGFVQYAYDAEDYRTEDKDQEKNGEMGEFPPDQWNIFRWRSMDVYVHGFLLTL